jgi:hypothetical protein
MTCFALSEQQSAICALMRDGRVAPGHVVIAIAGAVDASRLRAAWQRVVDRHEILRTALVAINGSGTLAQTPVASCTAPWTDIAVSGGDDERTAIERVLTLHAAVPFEREHPPLARATLVRNGASRSALVISLDPCCADYSTLDGLANEIARVYATADGTADEPVQYLQYCEYQRQVLGAAHPTETEATQLPQQTRENAVGIMSPPVVVTLSADRASALAHIAESYGTSTIDILLACWQTLIGQLSGARTVHTGLLVDGRPVEELRGTLGPLAMPRRVTCDLEPSLPFAQLVLGAANARAQAASTLDEPAWRPHNPPAMFAVLPPRVSSESGGVSFVVERLGGTFDSTASSPLRR